MTDKQQFTNNHAAIIDTDSLHLENIRTPSKIYLSVCAHMKILVAEDDMPLAEFLSQRLQHEQFAVQIATTVHEAHRLASDQPFDLVLLDLNLEGARGLDVLRRIRTRKPDLPVMLMTGAGALEDRIRALDAGADDYVSKPFAFAELAARIRALLRRGGRPGHSILEVDDLKLDRLSHTVRRAGRAIDLSPKEFALLEFLMMHCGQPVSRPAIVEQVWKLNFDTMTNVVDVYINYLRRKIDSGFDRALIRTVRGVGYQISGELTPVAAHATVASEQLVAKAR